MSAIMWVGMAVMLYAGQNVFLEQKLSNYSTASLLFYCYAVMFPAAAIRFAYEKMYCPEAVAPTGSTIVLVLLFGLVYYFADFCYLSAFTKGKGSAVTITTVIILVPVLVSLIKNVEKPNVYHVVSYGLAALSVLAAVKASGK